MGKDEDLKQKELIWKRNPFNMIIPDNYLGFPYKHQKEKNL